jgi:hypothetical protein
MEMNKALENDSDLYILSLFNLDIPNTLIVQIIYTEIIMEEDTMYMISQIFKIALSVDASCFFYLSIDLISLALIGR